MPSLISKGGRLRRYGIRIHRGNSDAGSEEVRPCTRIHRRYATGMVVDWSSKTGCTVNVPLFLQWRRIMRTGNEVAGQVCKDLLGMHPIYPNRIIELPNCSENQSRTTDMSSRTLLLFGQRS
ncbi:hypothetical protein LZ32DRAFT_144250 [Colletotrichum eremochloae]|nr:hypothetical protein LZ32DRAFT_144250 [Colletotrichum eremochloae]